MIVTYKNVLNFIISQINQLLLLAGVRLAVHGKYGVKKLAIMSVGNVDVHGMHNMEEIPTQTID